MKVTISDLLQTFLFHRDNERREAERRTSDPVSYEWPDLHEHIQNLWTVDVTKYEEFSGNSDLNGASASLGSFEDYTSENGCLLYEVDGRSFWIPSALAGFMPSAAVLTSLYDTANSCRHFDEGQSRMCLSGSSVLMGEFEMVGDLDLFEYVPESAVRKALKTDGAQYEKGSMVCVEVAVGQTVKGQWPRLGLIKRDKTELSQKKMRTYAAKLLDRFDFCKIDMIGKFNGQIGEISNIVFKHSDDFDFKGSFPSFAFQEVVVGKAPPPKEAFALKNFGEFLFWLRDEIQSGLKTIETSFDASCFDTDDDAQDKAIKISKRAMMLARLTNQDSELGIFRDALRARESQHYALDSAEACLKPLRRSGAAEDEGMVVDALAWISERQRDLATTPPPTLDIEKLITSLHNVLTTFDRLCYPGLPLE